MIPNLTCYRCRGGFTLSMTMEKKNGHVYHAFCVDKERRVEQGLDSEIEPTVHNAERRNTWGFPDIQIVSESTFMLVE